MRCGPPPRVWVRDSGGGAGTSRFRRHSFRVLEFWDEESVGALDSGDPAVEHSWSAVCLAESFVQQLEPCSRWFSRAVVVLGPSHTSYLLDRCAPFIQREPVGDAYSRAFARECGSY